MTVRGTEERHASCMQTASERVRFAKRSDFARDLETSADAYFTTHGKERRDLPRMYLKTIIILLWFVGSWALLVFGAKNGWQGALSAISLGLSIAGVGMSIQHDANHGAYSKHKWINRIFGSTLDVMGVSSFIWRPKHNIGHHTFTNIQDIDFDLDFGSLARLAPTQTYHPWHRYQHLYLWFFYGFLLPKWVFYDDFVILRRRWIGAHRLPAPGPLDLATFAFWKIFFVAWAIVIPAMFHPLWQVLLFHALAAFTLGVTLGTVFQLAHCTGAASFPPLPIVAPASMPPGPGHMPTDWATHQLQTTVDFGPRNDVLTWFVGGLNYQVVHHLFPKVCHLHYPALSAIVTDVAVRHGLVHRSERTLGHALSAHFTHLRAMGCKPVLV